MRLLNSRTNVACLIGLSMLLTAGCGPGKPPREPTFPVTGTVTFNGSPVADASVVLVPGDPSQKGAMGNTDASGNFELTTYEKGDGAMSGEYRVRVFKYEMTNEPDPTSGSEPLPDYDAEDFTEDYGEDYTGEEEVAESKNLLPAKYENPGTSGLTHTVADAPSTLNIDL